MQGFTRLIFFFQIKGQCSYYNSANVNRFDLLSVLDGIAVVATVSLVTRGHPRAGLAS